MSWKGEAKLTPATRVALSVSGTNEGGCCVLSVSGTSEGGRWAGRLTLVETWAWKAFTTALAASFAISRLDCCTVSLISCRIACICPSVKSGLGVGAASSLLVMFGPGCVAHPAMFWPREGGVEPRSRRSSVFRVPVEVSPCWTQRERRSAIERAPNTVGSTYGGALRRVVLLGARGGITCAVTRSEFGNWTGQNSCTREQTRAGKMFASFE